MLALAIIEIPMGSCIYIYIVIYNYAIKTNPSMDVVTFKVRAGLTKRHLDALWRGWH